MIITSLWTDTNRVCNTGKFSQVLADSNKNRIVQEFNQRCTSFRCWAQNGSRKVLLSKAVGLLHCCGWLNLMTRSDVGDWIKILLTSSDDSVGGQDGQHRKLVTNATTWLDRFWWQMLLTKCIDEKFEKLVKIQII